MKTKGKFLLSRMTYYAEEIARLYESEEKKAKFAHSTARNIIKQLKIYELLLQEIHLESAQNYAVRIHEMIEELATTQEKITEEYEHKNSKEIK